MILNKHTRIKLLVESLHDNYPSKHNHLLSRKYKAKEIYLPEKLKIHKKQSKEKENKKKSNWEKEHKFLRNSQRRSRVKANYSYRMSLCLRNRMRQALRDNRKLNSTIILIGCSTSDLKQHLENQFSFGMNWKNYGFGWHIDHIIPCSKFDLSKLEEQKKCFHYTNLQPLWARENLSKAAKC